MFQLNKSIDKDSVLADLEGGLVSERFIICYNMDHPMGLHYITLWDLVDENAPYRTKEVPRRPLFPRYTNDIQAAKKHGKYSERLRIMTGLCVHCEMFKVGKNQVSNTLATAKSKYYNKKGMRCHC